MIHYKTRIRWAFALCMGLLSLFTLIACGQDGPAVVTADKPSNPLQVTLQPLEAVAPGKIVTFEATVSSLSPFTDVVLQIEIPSPLRLVSGPLRWQGALNPATPHAIRFTIYLPPEGGRPIRATATVPGNNGSIGSEAVYTIGGEQGETSSGVRITPHTAPPTSDGHPVMEYPLK